MKRFFGILLTAIFAVSALTFIGCSSSKSDETTRTIITVENGQFMRNGKPYYFVGTNFWYGAILGSEGEGQFFKH